MGLVTQNMLLLYIYTIFLLFTGNYKHMHGLVSITSSFKELCLESEVMFYSEFSKVTLFRESLAC